MSVEDQFHVYITGEALEGYDLADAQVLFAEKFKLTSEKVQKIFLSPMPFRIKKGIDSKTAEAYKKAIHAMGLDSQIAPAVAPSVDATTMTLVSREEQEKSSVTPQIATESKSYATVVEPKITSGTDLEILYETPGSELSEEGSTGFGGWLRFFQVVNILSIVLFVLVSLVVLGMVFLEGVGNQEILDMLAGFTEMIPGFVFSILILKILGRREEGIPHRISSYLKYSIGISGIVFIGSMALFYADILTEKPASILGSLIYYYIWTSYFKKSTRVNEYYGCNAV